MIWLWISISILVYILIGGVVAAFLSDEWCDDRGIQLIMVMFWPFIFLGAGAMWIVEKYISLLRKIIKRWEK